MLMVYLKFVCKCCWWYYCHFTIICFVESFNTHIFQMNILLIVSYSFNHIGIFLIIILQLPSFWGCKARFKASSAYVFLFKKFAKTPNERPMNKWLKWYIYLFWRKFKNMMKYLGLYHLLKWNPQNCLISRQTCVEVAKILWYLHTFEVENFVKTQFQIEIFLLSIVELSDLGLAHCHFLTIVSTFQVLQLYKFKAKRKKKKNQ
jgi:hypothetical protein